MSLFGKSRRSGRGIPRAPAYDERRERRVILLTILGGLCIAIVFGLMLYTLNVNGRIK